MSKTNVHISTFIKKLRALSTLVKQSQAKMHVKLLASSLINRDSDQRVDALRAELQQTKELALTSIHVLMNARRLDQSNATTI
jgi:hypothetical protein